MTIGREKLGNMQVTNPRLSSGEHVQFFKLQPLPLMDYPSTTPLFPSDHLFILFGSGTLTGQKTKMLTADQKIKLI